MAMTDISGPLSHQLPLHNHRGGLVQTSLVMNHHLDMECHGSDSRMGMSKFSKNHFILLFVVRSAIKAHRQIFPKSEICFGELSACSKRLRFDGRLRMTRYQCLRSLSMLFIVDAIIRHRHTWPHLVEIKKKL